MCRIMIGDRGRSTSDSNVGRWVGWAPMFRGRCDAAGNSVDLLLAGRATGVGHRRGAGAAVTV